MACVDIVTPSFRGSVRAAKEAVDKMIITSACRCGDHYAWECTRGKHSIYPALGTSQSIIHWNRNAGIAAALYGPHPGGRPEAEYLFLIDDDMVPEANYLNRLIAQNKDIVSGICTVRKVPPRPTILLWNDQIQNYYWPKEWDRNAQKLIEVDACGAAFVLIRRKVFERMGEAYLSCFFERERDKRKYGTTAAIDKYWDAKAILRKSSFDKARQRNSWQDMTCWWFEFISDAFDSHVGEMGEDVSFFWKAKKLGFRAFADPQVLPGHLGEYAYSVHDYWAHLDAQKVAEAVD